MRLSDAELTSICERASTLSERLAGEYVPTGDNTSLAARRLARWQHLSGQDWRRQLAALQSTLGREPIAESELLPLLGPVRRKANMPLPSWASFLNEIVKSVAQSFGSAEGERLATELSRSRGRDIPFEHLYWPLAEFAWGQVIRDSTTIQARLDIRARRSLQKHLVQRISSIASSLLHTTFLAHQAVERSGMLHHLFSADGRETRLHGSTRQYTSFVAEQGKNGLRSLFMRFPIAARLIAEVTELWIAFVREFLDRLHSDQKRLADHFNAGTTLEPLADVKTGMSDPHRGGRSVLILRFKGGLRLVYKPRPMEIDRMFYELVREVNGRSPVADLAALNICERPRYGWMEFAKHASCQDDLGTKRYYQRAGALACLVHWLQGIDFHRENVVAAGEYPVLVDLECLAHPLRPEEISFGDIQAPSSLARSVLRTGLLPMWQPRKPDAPLYDNSGFNGPIRQRSLIPIVHWKCINSDQMHWVSEVLNQHHAAHRPLLGRRVLSISSFEPEVLAGYQRMSNILEKTSDPKLSMRRGKLYETCRRRIKRATFIYGIILRRSLEPRSLSEGVDRSIELLALPYALGDEQDWTAEIASLERLDVPYFQWETRKEEREALAHPIRISTKLSEQAEIVRLSVRRLAKLSGGVVCPMTPRRRA